VATLEQIIKSIQDIVQDDVAYPEADIASRINESLQRIAAGVFMQDRGRLSPPLPDLFVIDTVETVVDQPWVALPEEYQRGLERVEGESLFGIQPPRGGDFYSFNLFMDRVPKRDLSETGAVYIAAVRGKRLYYQGIPESPETLTLHFYRKPATLSLSVPSDEPEGIPEHLQRKLLTHDVCAEIFGEGIEDGENSGGSGVQYHLAKRNEALEELIRFIPGDTTPYHVPEDEDYAVRY
jgi:hypothetical protein